ncbi:glycosyltransferase family 4 protein [candidate division WOR-3 bacterium]|nr:glycosyltransferase family 4 protein [candidate division WOR-3 bacterium]
MRILMVSDVYYPHPGGVPEHIYHLSLELIRKGHRVTVMAPRIGEIGSVDGDSPEVIRVGRGISVFANRSHSKIALSLDIEKRVKDILAKRFDVVHIHGFVPMLPFLALKYSDTRNIVTVHAAYKSNLSYSISKKWLGKYTRKLDARIAVSCVAKRSISRYFPGRYEIIPNGVDIDRFNPGVEPLLEFDKGFNILFIGRFEPRKGLKYLLRAFPKIKKEIPEARLIIVGSGIVNIPKQDDIVVKKFPPPSMIPRFYASSDIFCSPATGNESFGIVLLEAMASGVPVVASSIPGYRSVVKEGETGILVEKENPSSISQAIINLARDKKSMEEIGKKGREYACLFSWDKIADRVEGVYKDEGC